MNDDLDKKIKQITDILGQDNIPDNLKSLLTLIAGSSSKEETSPGTSETPAVKSEKVNMNELESNIDMVRRIKKIMERINSASDFRINLLTAIRPFLNSTRQKKLNNCIKLLHMSNLTKFVDEHDESSL